jgi:hypothetical protein
LKGKTVEELYTLSAGRWDILVSKVEPGTVEHEQGANLAVTVYCDGSPFAGYAYVERKCGEGSFVEDGVPLSEGPESVGFVLSRRDVQKLEFVLARVHELLRGGSETLGAAGRERPTMPPGQSGPGEDDPEERVGPGEG